jgi:hypothetical protein
MREPEAGVVACRVCNEPVARDAATCPSCGVKAPWVPDEPTLSPRVIRLAMWGGSIVLVILLLFASGMLLFGPAAEDDKRDHRPPSIGTHAYGRG